MINQEQKLDEIIKAKNVSVSYDNGRIQDDYKSKVFRFLKNRGSIPKPKKVWPLKDINFSGFKGEIIGIIGSNGAGKTTLSKVIANILKEDKGIMHVDGKVTALFSFGMGFNKELTGRENVYLNGMMLGIDKEKINFYFDEIHEFSDLGHFIDEPMKHYSSGMRARLGFSVAAHLEPEVLILDEALNTGDAKFSQKAAQKMKELVQQAKIVIIVTHSLGYAQRNCDRLIWLDKGSIMADGDPKEIVKKYKESRPPQKKVKKRSLELNTTETVIKDNVVIKAETLGVKFPLKNQSEKDFWALKNVNFEINEGEVVGIIGHNGAGKSTLCKVLTRILVPDEGQVEINGNTSSLLGYGTGFNQQLSGEDNIYLNAMLLGIPIEVVKKHYQDIVDFSGLGSKIENPVKEYSSGMKSRLGFSIAAMLKPDIFIIDEALSTGDLSFRQKATERIQDMMELSKAVIIVTHSMNFVEKVCTRAIWLENGEIRYDGDTSTAIKKYQQANK